MIEKPKVEKDQRVEQGDVLGYVGRYRALPLVRTFILKLLMVYQKTQSYTSPAHPHTTRYSPGGSRRMGNGIITMRAERKRPARGRIIAISMRQERWFGAGPRPKLAPRGSISIQWQATQARQRRIMAKWSRGGI